MLVSQRPLTLIKVNMTEQDPHVIEHDTLPPNDPYGRFLQEKKFNIHPLVDFTVKMQYKPTIDSPIIFNTVKFEAGKEMTCGIGVYVMYLNTEHLRPKFLDMTPKFITMLVSSLFPPLKRY